MEFELPLYIALIPAAIAAAGLFVGLFLFAKVRKLLGAIIGSFAVLFGALFGPMLLMDRVVIDEHRIHQSTGLWFDQTEKGFAFDGIERVTITTGRDLNNREIEIWIAHYRAGTSVEVDPGDLWESNGVAIAAYMGELGIEVTRVTP